jgi:DNA processing protein
MTEAGPDEIQRRMKISAAVAGRLASLDQNLPECDRLARRLKEYEVSILVPRDEEYPRLLRRSPRCPHALFVKGVHPWQEGDRFLSIVGARRASSEGQHLAFCTAAEAVQRGWTVVSGFARGIDVAAHRGALEHGGNTVLVLPYGILELYRDRLFRGLGDLEGLFDENLTAISQFHPQAKWQTEYALRRNRTIAALSPVTLVVEAGPKGGTHRTASDALKLSRILCVAKWDEENQCREGNSALLARGANPVPADQGASLLMDEIERLKDTGHRL